MAGVTSVMALCDMGKFPVAELPVGTTGRGYFLAHHTTLFLMVD
jgi:hypothetical protein